MGFEGISWLQVGFYSYRSIFHSFRWFFRFFYGSRSGFHDSKWIFIVPGWFKSELSAAGAK